MAYKENGIIRTGVTINQCLYDSMKMLAQSNRRSTNKEIWFAIDTYINNKNKESGTSEFKNVSNYFHTINLRIYYKTYSSIKKLAEQHRRSINSEICIALEQYIDGDHGK